MVEEKSKEGKKEYKLVEVPTNFGIAIQTPLEEVLTTEQAIVELLNLVQEVKEILKS